MRFFEGKFSRFERMLLTLVGVFVLYYSSYYFIREGHTTREVGTDRCPIVSCDRVDLPKSVYYLYYPLVRADQYVDLNADFHFH